MEAYGAQTTRSGYNPYQGTQSSRRQPVLIIEDSEEEVQREAYKVNWKIAIPLLCVGLVPGLIYLAGVAIANCLGGREVRREPQDYTSGRGSTPSYQQYQQTVRREESRRTALVADERTPLSRTPDRHERSSRKDRSGETREVRHTKKERKSKRREESPSVVDRAVTRSAPRSAIPSQPRSHRKKDADRSSTRVASMPTPSRISEPAVPVSIREGREPRTTEERVAVNIYMGTRVINMSAIEDKAERIAAMKKSAKMRPYSKTAEPGSFQGFLKMMYNSSYNALYPNG